MKLINSKLMTLFCLTAIFAGCRSFNSNAPHRLNGKNADLMEASLKGDREGALQALAEGADINYRERLSSSETPLMQVVRHNNVELVKLLLDKGAEINAEDDHGQTALSIAESGGNKEIINILKAAGAKTRIKSEPEKREDISQRIIMPDEDICTLTIRHGRGYRKLRVKEILGFKTYKNEEYVVVVTEGDILHMFPFNHLIPEDRDFIKKNHSIKYQKKKSFKKVVIY